MMMFYLDFGEKMVGIQGLNLMTTVVPEQMSSLNFHLQSFGKLNFRYNKSSYEMYSYISETLSQNLYIWT